MNAGAEAELFRKLGLLVQRFGQTLQQLEPAYIVMSVCPRADRPIVN